jgi:peroxiredoxin
MPIQVGDEAPDFELPSSELGADGKPGKPVKLSDFRGKKAVILAFYPLDFSPTCSKEMECFREDLTTFDGAGAQVLGISVDSKWTHAAFAKHIGLKYPLLADFHPKGATAQKYGLFKEQLGFASRATVVVDKAGKVAYVKETPLGEQRDNKEILEAVRKAG